MRNEQQPGEAWLGSARFWGLRRGSHHVHFSTVPCLPSFDEQRKDTFLLDLTDAPELNILRRRPGGDQALNDLGHEMWMKQSTRCLEPGKCSIKGAILLPL